ncbi:MAG: heavy metal-responsive transcriptional regulator [Waterburya sp.]
MQIQEQTFLKIGELSTQSGVSIKTIRYYEELGLVKSSKRTEGHFRLFHPDMVTRLAFIKRLQSLGLSLQEISECLTVYDRGNLPCGNVKSKLEQQVAKIDRQVAELMFLRRDLTEILQHWSTSPDKQPEVICPNLQI